MARPRETVVNYYTAVITEVAWRAGTTVTSHCVAAGTAIQTGGG